MSTNVQVHRERLAAAEGAAAGAPALGVRCPGARVAQRVPARHEGGVDGLRQTDTAQPGRGTLFPGRRRLNQVLESNTQAWT